MGRRSPRRWPNNSLAWRAIAGATALLFASVSWGALAVPAGAAGAASVGVSLSKSSIVANGSDASTATATVTDSSAAPVPGETVTFTAPGDAVSGGSTCMTGADGTCSVTITSTTVGQSSVTASDGALTSAGVSLTRTVGPAAAIALQLSKASIVANGSDASTATATVTDGQGHPLSGEAVAFTAPGDAVSGGSTCMTGADGTCSVTITSTTVGQSSVTASDGALTSAGVSLTRTVGPRGRDRPAAVEGFDRRQRF